MWNTQNSRDVLKSTRSPKCYAFNFSDIDIPEITDLEELSITDAIVQTDISILYNNEATTQTDNVEDKSIIKSGRHMIPYFT